MRCSSNRFIHVEYEIKVYFIQLTRKIYERGLLFSDCKSEIFVGNSNIKLTVKKIKRLFYGQLLRTFYVFGAENCFKLKYTIE